MTNPSLSRVLVLDAISGAAIFVLGVFATAPIAGLTGLPASIVAIGGWICLAAAATFAILAIKPMRWLLALGVAGNAAWVLASIGVWIALLADLAPFGHAFVLAQAAIVAWFTLQEARGLSGNAAARHAIV
jgi:uncharacterized membrane protein